MFAATNRPAIWQFLWGICAALAINLPLKAEEGVINTNPKLTSAQDALQRLMSELPGPEFPGCAVGIVQSGALILTAAQGVADLKSGSPITADTPFGMASMYKQFVAAAVLRAHQEKRLSLDDDIRKWLPEIPDYGATITIYHLVHHTSGIRDSVQLRAVANLPGDITPEDELALLSKQRALNFEPGERHLYSNGGYLLLTQIVKRATGKSAVEYGREQFFDSLGMQVFMKSEEPSESLAIGYTREGDHFAPSQINHVSPFVSVNTMSAWMIALLEDRIGPPGFSQAMMKRGKLNDGQAIDYTFGLDVGEHRGLRVIIHGGAGSGFRTGMALYPEQELGIVVLCNLSHVNANWDWWREISESLLADVMEHETPPPDTQYTMMHPPPPGVPPTLSQADLQSFAGRYHGPELGVEFDVLVEGEGLRIGPPDRKRPVVPQAENIFGQPNGWSRFTFQRDESGAVVGFTLDIGRVSGLIFERVEEPGVD